ncbi:hypothetical protein TD95_004031 [Thielaviopsis punctulata]|uniref:Uncharacterized protein n=1 Tax=Thielaviopsis punctulata TaxID=72032 RepID=A0A0F4ZF11_9PEZI|nr:hypothetical protein TD95_004031 [Thielaviopsis punctulata]
MGVTGLWQVVQPCARPTNIATLNRKRLAVDASIWIYQFLKAVRDSEGNALRSSHVVGFFRRICKLLWFGILPVFVFDGSVPALKRQTIQSRRQRREGRREDASRMAGKLLAVQMQRLANEEVERQRRTRQRKTQEEKDEEEYVPGALTGDLKDAVYVDDLGLLHQEHVAKNMPTQQESTGKKKFVKQDPYHLPDLDGGVGANANPQDPRIMSVAELEEYARQFNAGEDINLYDFSNIDFDGDFFKSLPPADRYYILNAARLRSRLRMGLSKEQLEVMFPNRMDFSRFQIERVKERNNLTQRLMKELGMSGLDLTINGAGRIAGDMNREYILVRNESAEGGWALGVVNRDRDLGKAHKPIDVDATTFEFETRMDEDEDEDFEDVPIEGLNRLPKTQALAARAQQQQLEEEEEEDDDAMFVGGDDSNHESRFQTPSQTERDEIDLAIALSLESQKKQTANQLDEYSEMDEMDAEAPQWKQKAVLSSGTASRPITKFNLNLINRRANTEVNNPSTKEVPDQQSDDSESDIDLQVALARSRREKAKGVVAPVLPTISAGGFDGPLPFPKLDWNAAKKVASPLYEAGSRAKEAFSPLHDAASSTQDAGRNGGGFICEGSATESKANNELPPWMTDETDIVESLKKQQEDFIRENERARELAAAEEEAYQQFRPPQSHEVVEIEDDNSEVEVVDVPRQVRALGSITTANPLLKAVPDQLSNQLSNQPSDQPVVLERLSESAEPEFEDVFVPESAQASVKEDFPDIEFEDVIAPVSDPPKESSQAPEEPIEFEIDDDELFGDHSEDENLSDQPDDLMDMEDDQLLAQLAEEVEEHARFTNKLRNRPEHTSHAAIDAELRLLRDQQRRFRRDADEVTESMAIECQALLRLFGIPFITAPMEAEAQCAELVRLGLVDGVITDDSDTFLFGGTRIYKNMFSTNKFVECYITADFERELSLDREALISLAQLLGSDYTEGLPGVGPVTAMEILSEFPGKDGLAHFKQWWDEVQTKGRPIAADAASAFRRKFRKAQGTKLFLPEGFPSAAVHAAYMRPEVDRSTEGFQWGQPDLEGLRRFLMGTVGWSQERTDEVLVPVIRDMNKRDREGTQANITKYFQGGVGVGTLDAFAPRQKVKTSKRMAKAVDRLRRAAGGGESLEEEEEEAARSVKRKRGKTRGRKTEEDGDYEAGDEENDGDYQADSAQRKAARRRP